MVLSLQKAFLVCCLSDTINDQCILCSSLAVCIAAEAQSSLVKAINHAKPSSPHVIVVCQMV